MDNGHLYQIKFYCHQKDLGIRHFYIKYQAPETASEWEGGMSPCYVLGIAAMEPADIHRKEATC